MKQLVILTGLALALAFTALAFGPAITLAAAPQMMLQESDRGGIPGIDNDQLAEIAREGVTQYRRTSEHHENREESFEVDRRRTEVTREYGGLSREDAGEFGEESREISQEDDEDTREFAVKYLTGRLGGRGRDLLPFAFGAFLWILGQVLNSLR